MVIYQLVHQGVIMKRISLEGNKVIFRFSFCRNTIKELKTLGARFNPTEKNWYLPVGEVHRVLDLSGDDWDISCEVTDLLEAYWREKELEFHYNLDEPFPDGRVLYQHQKEAVEWALSTLKTDCRGGILALDMGLGKTCVALVVAKIYQQHFPDVKNLVICPASLKENWRREAQGVGVPVEIYSWQKQPEVPEVPYFLIVDEAHYAQSGQRSKRGAAFLDLCTSAYCKGKLLLTGTPMKNGRPINLMPLLEAIKHPIVASRRDYQIRYCDAKPTKYCRWDVSGASNLNELHEKVKGFLFRRTKKECLDLPPKIRIMVPAEVTGRSLELYNDAKREAMMRYRENRHEPGAPLALMTALRKAGSKAKIEQALRMTEELLEQDQQVVVFTEFLETAKELHEKLGGCLLTGATPVNQRQEMVDMFQSGREKVFVSISGAGGVGITLTASQNVILLDRPLTSGDVIQCEDRCHRIGTAGTVYVYWIQYDSIDEKIDDMLANKQRRIDLVLEGKRKTMRGLGDPFDYLEEIADQLVQEATVKPGTRKW